MPLNKAIVGSLPYAQELASRGIRLSMPANSDFLPLVRAAAPMDLCRNGTDKDFFIDAVSAQQQVITGSLAPLGEYDMLYSAMKDELVRTVSSHIRNSQLIAEQAGKFAERVEEYKKNIPDTSPVSRFTILQDPLADVFESGWFADLIANRSPIAGQVESNIVSGFRDPEVLAEMIKTGESDIDKQIVQAMSFFAVGTDGRPRSILEDVYNGFILGRGDVAKNYTREQYRMLPAGERLLALLLHYLLVDKLEGEVPADAIGSLSEFGLNCRNQKAQLQQAMYNTFEEKKYQVQSGQVIIYPDYTDNSMVVDKSSYDAFLEAGGSPEIVLGCKVGSLGLFSGAELGEFATRCASAWRNFALLHGTTAENERCSILASIYKVLWDESLSNGPEFEMAHRAQNPGLIGDYTAFAFKFIEEQPLEALERTQDMALHLMAGIRYEYTPALMFLQEMAKAHAKHPGISPREAASVATVKYIASYVATQIATTHV